jgi:hypothetical protein
MYEQESHRMSANRRQRQRQGQYNLAQEQEQIPTAVCDRSVSASSSGMHLALIPVSPVAHGPIMTRLHGNLIH